MTRTLRLVLFLSAAMAGPVMAQDEISATWAVSGTAGVVTDYRYRGYSLSDERPAAQAGLTASHVSGVYGDVYLSTIDEYGIGDDGDGAEIEATLTLGWAGAVAGFDVGAAIAAYHYPGGTDVSYFEIPVQVARTRGPLTGTLGAAWAPDGQTALGDDDNRYVWGGLDLAPATWPVSLRGTVGFEEGAYAPEGKTDWLLGMAVPFGPTVLGFDYVDSDADTGAVVASVFVSF